MKRVRVKACSKSDGLKSSAIMSVLSILNRLKVDAKFVVPLLFVIGILAKNVFCNSPATSREDEKLEKLPFCDEDLINDRASVSKR